MAHILRAILFASAIATNIRGFLVIIRASQEPYAGGFLLAQFTRTIAPMISNRRISACPAFDTLPSLSLDRVPLRGVADGMVAALSGMGPGDQRATAGRLMRGSSLI
ncbi:hypothetical protein BPNPMPFG_007048 (plasmid) [Mesorhizobium sp. AR07]|nr:hypothetical protein BPNPMPFG_007048 [Mesorhizobium sp. AR07]